MIERVADILDEHVVEPIEKVVMGTTTRTLPTTTLGVAAPETNADVLDNPMVVETKFASTTVRHLAVSSATTTLHADLPSEETPTRAPMEGQVFTTLKREYPEWVHPTMEPYTAPVEEPLPPLGPREALQTEEYQPLKPFVPEKISEVWNRTMEHKGNPPVAETSTDHLEEIIKRAKAKEEEARRLRRWLEQLLG